MGLDMYLERYPRYRDYGPEDIHAVEDFEEWKASGNDCDYKEWCGREEEDIPKGEDFEFFKRLISTQYWDWDDEHKYPHDRIYEQVAYWRKANAIHRWFVENIQDGEDDCEYHREVTEEDLKRLVRICEEVLEGCVLIKGKVKNGSVLKNGKFIPNYQDGYLIANPEVAAELLPCEDGFFFGSTEYNEWYMDDVKYTYEKLKKVLEETDFEKQMLYYRSSW